MAKATTDNRPRKPYPDFPLFPDKCGRWAKRINGKPYHFGRWGFARKGKVVPYSDDVIISKAREAEKLYRKFVESVKQSKGRSKNIILILTRIEFMDPNGDSVELNAIKDLFRECCLCRAYFLKREIHGNRRVIRMRQNTCLPRVNVGATCCGLCYSFFMKERKQEHLLCQAKRRQSKKVLAMCRTAKKALKENNLEVLKSLEREFSQEAILQK